MKQNRFHCCATCKHFIPKKSESGIHFYCSRLGYETKTTYVFDCWDPIDRVRQRIDRESRAT